MKELPVCAIGDTARCSELMQQHGVVVFRNVLTSEEIKTSESKFWDWAEAASPGLKRSDPKTHLLGALGDRSQGAGGTKPAGPRVSIDGVASSRAFRSRHSCGASVRARCAEGLGHRVRFNELSVSFDGAGAWLNPHIHGESVATRGKWYHIDQFYGKTPQRKGFEQGLVTLHEADHDTGSVRLPALR